jgi:predicted O-methyltransferase YrrM
MDLAAYLLRKFSRVRELEQSVLQLKGKGAELESENRRMSAELAEWTRFCPLGHFYSPLPSREEVDAALSRGGYGPPFPAIELNCEEQVALLKEFAAYYPDLPFPEAPTAGKRFHLSNPSYGRYDAFVLYCMMRRIQPRRIIEVGCGFSSAAILDLNDALFGGRLELTFIDPDLAQLRRLLLPRDAGSLNLMELRVQDAPDSTFESLDAGDILFIDTSHVSKVGSDVNHLFFRVLPALKPGVHVHIHDITGDLEYPRQWFDEGRAWNEVYLLRAFLMYNRAFRVVFSSALMFNQHHDFLKEHMPKCAEGGGGQIWLRKDAAG